jgi:hypothetical protein
MRGCGSRKPVADKAWKAFERDVALAIDGKRFWSNSGEALDCESPYAHVQCKLVKVLPLEQLTQLAEAVEVTAKAAGKIGVVAVKRRRGKGQRSEALIVLPLASWLRLRDHLPAALRGIEVDRAV